MYYTWYSSGLILQIFSGAKECVKLRRKEFNCSTYQAGAGHVRMGCVQSSDPEPSQVVGVPQRWRSATPVTRAQIVARREEFWSTRAAAGGVDQVWYALRSAAEGVASSNLDHANAVLQASSVTTPNGDMSVCYDELGNRYEVPLWCYSSPENLSLSGAPPAKKKKKKASRGPSVKIACKLRFGGCGFTTKEMPFVGMSDASIGSILSETMAALGEREATAPPAPPADGAGEASCSASPSTAKASQPIAAAEVINAMADGRIVARLFFGGQHCANDDALGDVPGIRDDMVFQLFLRKRK